jgi:DNA-binding PadR family transcriptional regulator
MSKELSPHWVLLGLLMRAPMHGYELHQFFTNGSPLGHIWYLGISQMYKLLKELEDEGHVEVTVEPQENRPDKKVYRVTPSGEKEFLRWLRAPVRGIRLIRVEFLGKLFLAQGLGPEMVERLIDGQTEACERLKRSLEAGMSGGGFDDLVLRFRAGQIEAAIDWLDLCRAELLLEGRGTTKTT